MAPRTRLNQIDGLPAALAARRLLADPIAVEDLAPDVAELIESSGKISRGEISLLTLSNNVANPTTHLDFSLGQARSRDDTMDLVAPAGMTKRLDQTWAPGGGAGMRDEAAAIVPDVGYHHFILGRPSDGAVDFLASRSALNPDMTLPIAEGFTKFRRIHGLMLDAVGAYRPFKQQGDWIRLITRTTDYAATANGGGPFLRDVRAPAGLELELEMYFQSVGTSGTYMSGVYPPQNGIPGAFGVPTQRAQHRRTSDGTYLTKYIREWCNNNRQVYTFSNDSADVIVLGVIGWRDDRSDYL